MMACCDLLSIRANKSSSQTARSEGIASTVSTSNSPNRCSSRTVDAAPRANPCVSLPAGKVSPVEAHPTSSTAGFLRGPFKTSNHPSTIQAPASSRNHHNTKKHHDRRQPRRRGPRAALQVRGAAEPRCVQLLCYNLSIPANPCMTPNSKETNKQPPPPTNASVLPLQN